MQRIICNSLQLAGTTLFLVISWMQLTHAWEVQQVPNYYTRFGFGLYWRNPNLYMADFQSGQLKRLDTTTNQMYLCQIENENQLTFVLPESNADNLFIVGIRHYVGEVEWDGVSTICIVRRKLFTVETDDPIDTPDCLVDGRCDSKGRLFTGTSNCRGDFSKLRHHFYRYANGQLDSIADNLNISNGIIWNEPKNQLYHVDSGANTITLYQYDTDVGAASNQQVVFKLNEDTYPGNLLNMHVLSGVAIDTEGLLYVPVFGGKILKISTDTWQVIDQYEVPCPYTSYITFGGPNLDILYVATASEYLKDIDLPESCGNVFQITNTGAKGLPENVCVVN